MSPLEAAEAASYDRERRNYSYAEIARELGVSIGRVQRIEDDALTKCLFWCQDHGLRLEDLIDRRRRYS